MITKYFIIVAVLFMASIAFSQAPETLWTRTYGGADEDGAHSICFNGSAGYAIIGYTKSFGAGNRDIYFLKTTPFGDTIQTMTYGGAGEECGYYIKHTMDDGYIITGYGGGYPTHSALLIHKTDAGGNIIWSKSYGPDYWSFGYCVQPVIDDAGIETGYIISARLGDVNGHCLLNVGCLEYVAGGIDNLTYLNQCNQYVKGAATEMYNGVISNGEYTPVQCDSNVHKIILTDDLTINKPTAPVNGLSGQVINFIIKQDTVGNWTVTWDAAYKWPSGTVPTITATASAVDVITAQYDSEDDVWLCCAVQDFQ